MSSVEIPKTELQDVLRWGLRHPKFTVNIGCSHEETVAWAHEYAQANKQGNLLLQLNGIGDVDHYGGHIKTERRPTTNPLIVAQLFVRHIEGITPAVVQYTVRESPNRQRHFLSERTRASLEDGVYFEPSEQPNVEAFMTHLAIIKSVEDFDWTEAEAKAANYRKSANPDA